MRKIDLTGSRFGRLSVLREFDRNKWGGIRWECLCDCGKITVTESSSLRRGLTKSCGCYNLDLISNLTKSHGMSGTKIYTIWTGIIARCENPKHTSYDRYGAKGVSICPEWRNSFEAFYRDMGDIPDGCEINRKGGALEYNKENCEWVSLSLQAYDKGMLSSNTSGRTGVSFDTHENLWTAQLNKEGKVYKKRFKTFKEACDYRESLEITHYGFVKK